MNRKRLFTFFSVWKRTRTTRDGRPYLAIDPAVAGLRRAGGLGLFGVDGGEGEDSGAGLDGGEGEEGGAYSVVAFHPAEKFGGD